MNAVATAAGSVAAFLGANFMLAGPNHVRRQRPGSPSSWSGGGSGADRTGAGHRFPPGTAGPADTRRAIHGSVFCAVSTGWLHGVHTVAARPTVTATLAALAAHRMVFGINTLLVLVLMRHGATPGSTGLGPTALFGAPRPPGCSSARCARRWS